MMYRNDEMNVRATSRCLPANDALLSLAAKYRQSPSVSIRPHTHHNLDSFDALNSFDAAPLAHRLMNATSLASSATPSLGTT